MQRFLEQVADPRPWDRDLFEAAVMLHTDAALALTENRSEDSTSLEPVLFHVDVAGQLLKLAASRWDIHGFASRWYVAVARVLRDRNWITTAERHLEFGRNRLPNDPGTLYESATLAELFATATQLPGAQPQDPRGATRAVQRDTWSGVQFGQLRQRRAGYLNRAASWLDQSLERVDDPLARLHLGRIQMLLKNPDDAERQLRAALTSPDESTAYLARLFIGALYERQHRLIDALEAYRSADERFPLQQSASIAQSELLRRLDRGDEARAVLQRLLDSNSGERDDPWVRYFFERPGMADARLDEIRQTVRR